MHVKIACFLRTRGTHVRTHVSIRTIVLTQFGLKKKKVVHNVRRDLIRLEWKALIIGRKEKKKKKKGMYIYSSLIIKQFERSLSSGLLIVAMFPSKTIIAIAMYTLH